MEPKIPKNRYLDARGSDLVCFLEVLVTSMLEIGRLKLEIGALNSGNASPEAGIRSRNPHGGAKFRSLPAILPGYPGRALGQIY